MQRRRFLHTATGASLACASGGLAAVPEPAEKLVGIQIAPFSLLDEGIEAALDFMQETAKVNALFLYSQDYHIGGYDFNVLATDHPQPPRNPAGRELPKLWVNLPEEPFAKLPVKHQRVDPSLEYADRDLFAELVRPCRERGIRIYPRILEASMRRAANIPGYESVATIDLNGEPGHGPCWNHPGYRDWIRVTIEQLMKRYDVDGLQYGAERVGALSEVLFRGNVPECFCEHCVARNRERGLDVERTKEGYRRLLGLIRSAEEGDPPPSDGLIASVLRVLFEYPEVMAWYKSWFESDQEIQAMVYRTAKAVRPDADVGQHVDHQRSTWDIFYRAIMSYGKIAEHNDFIKPILYHDIMGPRLKEWVIDRWQQRIFSELTKDQTLELFYAVFGLDGSHEPGLATLVERGLSPDYVYRETKRCVEGAGGRAKVYSGIGVDVPHYVPGGKAPVISDREQLTEATRRAFEAGAAGVIASREYDEMTRPSLEAFGAGIG